MVKKKILQLASFEGNIGDNANIRGTRKLLKRNIIGFDLEFTDLEIRDFFYKRIKFDQKLIEYINTFDLFLVGGGNFFELWVTNSTTGTSIDLPVELFKKIKIPVVFYGLGVDPHQGAPEENLTKFRNFLDYAFSRDDVLVSVRNDGALKNMEKYVGKKYSEKTYQIADGGFFIDVTDCNHPEIPSSKKVIGMNLAGDMSDKRFPGVGDFIDLDFFLEELVIFFSKQFEDDTNLHLVLFPHIFRDLDIINRFILKLRDDCRRRRVTVAPYLHGFGSDNYIFDGYKKCDIILAMRFHSNVCGMAVGTPTLGLVNYPQISNLYQELKLDKQIVNVNLRGFKSDLIKKIKETFEDSEYLKKKYDSLISELDRNTTLFHNEMKLLLDRNEK